jgi:uncharacterized protein YggE
VCTVIGMNPAAASEPIVAVRGQWHGEAHPELARVFLTVEARGDDRSRVLAQVATRVEELRTIIAGYGEAVERVETSALRVMARFKDRKPTEKPTGYLAHLRLSVLVVDFGVLGDLVLRLADEVMVTVDGPHWSLRPTSPVYRRARTEAVGDARRRAEEYAAAIGSRLTGLVEIADVGLNDRFAGRYTEQAARLSGGFDDSAADRVTFDVQPAPLAVSAEVDARFTAAQPDFS